MEFDIETGHCDLEGNVEITLPEYMTMLPREEFDEARQAEQREQMIVAIGRRPNSDEVMFLTASIKLMTMKIEKHHKIPEGTWVPIDFGHGVKIEPHEFEIASDWLIENAKIIDVTLVT